MIFKSLIIFCVLITASQCANILAILPTPSYSHQIAYTHIWKELSLRGHKVTVMTTDPLKDPKLTNLTEIDLKWTYKLVEDIGKTSQTEFTMWNMFSFIHALLTKIAEVQVSSPEVQNLIHNKTKFDLVLVEFIFPEFLAFAEIYNCPKIVFCTIDAGIGIHKAVGNPTHPVLYPELVSSFYGQMSFKERLISTLYSWYTVYFWSRTGAETKNKFIKKYFNISRTVHELISDIDILFINVNPILQPIRAIGPSTITIGGRREIVDPTPLPHDVAEFLDSAVGGFIYFSLGSNVKSKDLIEETLDAVTEALRELPYKVLWKFEADEIPNKPENVKLIKWAPQQRVLSHPNLKVFVTQGGLQSMEEAIYQGVPLVVIPFFGDQEQNAKVMQSKGIGVIVNRIPSVDKVELKTAILEVINNAKYRNTVNTLKQLALDFPMTGLEKAVWWTEYVIRNKGAKHLRNPAADIPYYQYYLLDVIGFLVLVLMATLLFLFLILRIVYNQIKTHLFKSRKTQSVANKNKIE